MNDELIEIHTIAKGNVQGVGFRYTTYQMAKEIGLKGSVKNLPDGTVEIYAQGTKSEISLFCKQLENHWSGYMQPLELTPCSPLNSYTDFTIKK